MFEIGDVVEFIPDKEDYAYGLTGIALDAVQFGFTYEVQSIEPGAIIIRGSDGRTWSAHPNDIQLARPRTPETYEEEDVF